MTSLTDQQKQLLFDYCLGLASKQEAAQAQELVFSNEQAAKFVASLKAALSPLDSVTSQGCPDELAEGTIWRAQQALRTSRVRLDQLLTAERLRKVSPWRNLRGQLAAAAVFIVVAVMLLGSGQVGLNYARQKSWQNQCGSQLAGMFQSLSNYRADNADQMPTLTASPGATLVESWRSGTRECVKYAQDVGAGKEQLCQADRFYVSRPQTRYRFRMQPQRFQRFPEQKTCYIQFPYRLSEIGFK